ncbi:EAL domain-containing protein [Piscinibacterium candidicorallinum]|uniref:EAL domain-containing protein n=1 Tax=Piscinibacterium candidicorallinum TaxID=1793872 RepID=A0ABV7HB80_9BURK
MYVVDQVFVPGEFSERVSAALAQCQAGRAMVIALRLDRADYVEAELEQADAGTLSTTLEFTLRGLLQEQDALLMPNPGEVWLWFPRMASRAVATVATRRLLETVRQISVDRGVAVRGSAGIAVWPEHGEDLASLLRAARRTAVQAQTAHEPIALVTAGGSEDTALQDRESIAALLNINDIEVHLQPIVPMRTGGALAAEALLRLPPTWAKRYTAYEFVRTAERAGLSVSLLKAVLNATARAVTELADSGLQLDVSINVSPDALREPLLPDIIDQTLSIWRVPARTVSLEVTEGSLIENTEQAARHLSALRVRGFAIAIDDFGTGFSSLAYLQRLPLSKLKIDRLFVADMLHNKSSLAIVRTVIELAHNFGLTAIAEGVEDRPTLEALRNLGIDAVQGYVYSPALPPPEFLAWARANARA